MFTLVCLKDFPNPDGSGRTEFFAERMPYTVHEAHLLTKVALGLWKGRFAQRIRMMCVFPQDNGGDWQAVYLPFEDYGDGKIRVLAIEKGKFTVWACGHDSDEWESEGTPTAVHVAFMNTVPALAGGVQDGGVVSGMASPKYHRVPVDRVPDNRGLIVSIPPSSAMSAFTISAPFIDSLFPPRPLLGEVATEGVPAEKLPDMPMSIPLGLQELRDKNQATLDDIDRRLQQQEAERQVYQTESVPVVPDVAPEPCTPAADTPSDDGGAGCSDAGASDGGSE